MKALTLESKDIGKGNLILVNPSHPVRNAPGKETLVPIHPGYRDVLLEQQTAKMLAEVFSLLDCYQQILPVSGFRTLQEQETIYADSIRENGEDFTLQFVAAPNCSEHQTGLAIDLAENKPDIDFIRPGFPYTGICQTFREKAIQYGFIERYKSGREAITKIAHEPWHFRYIGYPHSELLEKEDLTLEEYTVFLKQFPYAGPHLQGRFRGRDIEIFYVPATHSGPAAIAIPDQTPYQVSGNNEDGFIITLWRNQL
ncbi:MAG: D-alanyl-D-alanine carboxypeptidase family protein [Syntrophomonadaceae bacterium]